MTKQLLISAAAAALVLTAAEANASAVYSADASTSLTLMSATNATNADGGTGELEIAVDASVRNEGTNTDGDASADFEFELNPSAIVLSLAPGNDVGNEGSITGRADDGSSEAFVDTTGEITMSNLSLTDTYEVTFELDFDLFASASVDDPDAEFAEAGAFATVNSNLTGEVTGTVAQGGVSTALSETVLDLALVAGAGGDPSLSDSGTLLITFLLAPGSAVDMFMFADAFGFGEGVAMDDVDMDVVPLPGALGFMAFGAAGLAGLRKRKARAA